MDIYDQAVEYLSELAREDANFDFWEVWASPTRKTGGILFGFAGKNRSSSMCGCLTQIRAGEGSAQTLDLTEHISADQRLPMDADSITIEMLPVFAEWQRKIDAELGRETPTHI